MTKEELLDAWRKKIAANGQVLKIKHKNMRTVEFYPMSYEESVFHKFTGWWISLQTNDPIVNDTIKIKKEDLVNWSIVD